MAEICKSESIEREIVAGFKCDYCAKECKADLYEDLPSGWHLFETDGFDYDHVCSIDCYILALRKGIECVKVLNNEAYANVDGFNLAFAQRLFYCLNKL